MFVSFVLCTVNIYSTKNSSQQMGVERGGYEVFGGTPTVTQTTGKVKVNILPVTMTVLSLASFSLWITGFVFCLSLFCRTIIPKKFMSNSTLSLKQNKILLVL